MPPDKISSHITNILTSAEPDVAWCVIKRGRCSATRLLGSVEPGVTVMRIRR